MYNLEMSKEEKKAVEREAKKSKNQTSVNKKTDNDKLV